MSILALEAAEIPDARDTNCDGNGGSISGAGVPVTRAFRNFSAEPAPVICNLQSGEGIGPIRLGRDCPCGHPHVIRRCVFRWDLSSLGGVPQSGVQAKIWKQSKLCDGTKRLGGGASGDPAAVKWIDATGTITKTMYDAAILWDGGNVIFPDEPDAGGTPTGYVIMDVTTPVNTAIAQGRTDFILRLQLANESDKSCQGGTAWFCLAGVKSAGAYFPLLEVLGPAAADTVEVETPLTITLSLLEPCVFIAGSVLDTLRVRPDTVRGYGKRALIEVPRGNTLHIEVAVQDNRTRPGAFVSGATVLLTLTAANGTVVLNGAVMHQVARGIYAYDYLTQPTDPLGLYLADVVVTA